MELETSCTAPYTSYTNSLLCCLSWCAHAGSIYADVEEALIARPKVSGGNGVSVKGAPPVLIPCRIEGTTHRELGLRLVTAADFSHGLVRAIGLHSG